MQNELRAKWLLFITSYMPLYLWILFSTLDYKNIRLENILKLKFGHPILRNVLVVLIAISVYKIYQLFKMDGDEQEELPPEMEISPESDSLMNYIVTYFTPLISFDISDNKSVLMNVLLFLLIGLMYVGSSASYLNPVLGIFGFKIFGVTGFPNAHHLISNLSFDEIETARKREDKLIRYRLGDGMYMIKKIKVENDD